MENIDRVCECSQARHFSLNLSTDKWEASLYHTDLNFCPLSVVHLETSLAIPEAEPGPSLHAKGSCLQRLAVVALQSQPCHGAGAHISQPPAPSQCAAACGEWCPPHPGQEEPAAPLSEPLGLHRGLLAVQEELWVFSPQSNPGGQAVCTTLGLLSS